MLGGYAGLLRGHGRLLPDQPVVVRARGVPVRRPRRLLVMVSDDGHDTVVLVHDDKHDTPVMNSRDQP